MKVMFLLFSFVFSLWIICSGQHLIGVEKSRIPALVKEVKDELILDKSVINQHFNYLKFINSAGTKTLLVFFDSTETSIRTRLICDYSELDFLLIELNCTYKKIDENSWEYEVCNEKIEVILEKKEWYFIVSTKKKIVVKANA